LSIKIPSNPTTRLSNINYLDPFPNTIKINLLATFFLQLFPHIAMLNFFLDYTIGEVTFYMFYGTYEIMGYFWYVMK
jgi:hypothetical protein